MKYNIKIKNMKLVRNKEICMNNLYEIRYQIVKSL